MEAQGSTFTIKVVSQWRRQQGSTDPQCLAYIDGKIAQAIDGNHAELVIAHNAIPGESHTVHVNAFTYDERPLVGFQTDLVLRNDRVEALFHELSTAFEVAIRLPQNDGVRHVLLERLEQALYSLDRREGQAESFRNSLPKAESIAPGIHVLARREMQPLITAFGHTHLDVAWLWRV